MINETTCLAELIARGRLYGATNYKISASSMEQLLSKMVADEKEIERLRGMLSDYRGWRMRVNA